MPSWPATPQPSTARCASLAELPRTAASPETSSRASLEFLFNQVDPFYRSMGLYVLAFLLACGSWLGKGPALRRSAFCVLVVAAGHPQLRPRHPHVPLRAARR